MVERVVACFHRYGIIAYNLINIISQNINMVHQAVTRAVAGIIDQGKGGINVLSNSCGSFLRAVDVGICTPVQLSDNEKSNEGFLRDGSFKLPTGTANFCTQEAMSLTSVKALLKAGGDAVDDMLNEKSDITVVAVGEVGMGNTTTAATLYAALTGASPEDVCGPGSGKFLQSYPNSELKKYDNNIS